MNEHNQQKSQSAENRFEFFWKKIKRWFSPLNKLAKILGGVMIGLLLLELGSLLILNIYLIKTEGANDQRIDLEMYKDQPWAEDYFREFQEASIFEYYPYLGFRRKPNYEGKYVNLDENSLRKTIPSCPAASTEETIRIFFFGGSTVWGSGSRDEGTIPSRLAEIFCRQNIPVKITNYGESGYVSTQEVIRLELELKKGTVPDLVIFYDGFNEVYSTYQNQEAGWPQNLDHRRKDFNLRQKFNPLGLMPNFNNILERIGRRLVKQGAYPAVGENLAEKSSELYLENARIVKLLGQEYGFKSIFFWQPAIFTKDYLTESEHKNPISEEMKQSFLQITAKAVDSSEIIDLSSIFKEHTETLYIDWSHITEQGNRIIAERMAEEVGVLINTSFTDYNIESRNNYKFNWLDKLMVN